AHLYRQRAEPDGLRHRQRARHQDAELLRLYAAGRGRACAGPGTGHLPFRRDLTLAFLALTVRARAARRALPAFAGGSTAIASISSRPPSRANPEIASVVLAGRFAAGR